MSAGGLQSHGVPEWEKQAYTEADVHAKLFEPEMAAHGFPARTSTQAEGEHFLEQRRLALHRLKSRRERGFYDGLYLIGNSPIVLCELKRYDALDSDRVQKRAVEQLKSYALSEDFAVPPPFLLLYCGKPERARFFRRQAVVDAPALAADPYEELSEIWSWERIKDAHLRGSFAEEVVRRERLLEILLHHLDRLEDDLRAPVTHAVQLVSTDGPPPLLTPFGAWLRDNPAAMARMRTLYERKLAEVARPDQRQVIEEMVTQAALNHLNKVFFLNLCEDRHLGGFYRILREFLPATRSETTPATAAVFLTLLRRKIRDQVGDWRAEEEAAYRALRGELTADIRRHVIEQNNWWELIRVAFDLAEEHFPLVYRDDAYDFFRPHTETLAELIYDLSTKSFRGLDNRSVGDIYQGLLSSRRQGASAKSGRQRQQAKLGAFYTPRGDVEYMVSRLNLRRDSVVLDPCMGSGHFLEGISEALLDLYAAEGYSREDAYREVVGRQLYGADIDTFATSLAAIRLFLLDESETREPPNLFVHDMLLHSPERPGTELFSNEVLQAEGRERATAERVVGADPAVDALERIDEVEFDAVVGNPPYGARKPAYKAPIYARLYGRSPKALAAGSVGTGDADSYAMFFANGIERLREGGRLCLITNDSFRSLTTHAALRRRILDRCKVVEILLTDTRHFEGVSFQFAGMAITTLEKCSDADARADHVMRLVDYVREPADFGDPPAAKVSELRQSEYEALPETPFFVGVPREVFEAAKGSLRVRDVARGRVGVQTGEDKRFLAGIAVDAPGLTRVVDPHEVATGVDPDERAAGFRTPDPHWVPYAKGEGYGDYWRPPGIAINWSQESVAELERRAALPSGTPRKAYLRNRPFYFKAGLTYSVISSGRVSARLLPEGCVFGDKGSAVFVEDPDASELFLLGYFNSALATYFMKKLVNTTATAHIGYLEKLPHRRPSPELEAAVVGRVDQIIEALKADPEADVTGPRDHIDELIFDLFEIRTAREEVRRFHRSVGRAEEGAQAARE
ncbi:MAG: N-6 DNA methylase [Thermoleophilaceae bacterium]|nr:N-6 DNA methylase [Thermoleophilaceae bacterium]